MAIPFVTSLTSQTACKVPSRRVAVKSGACCVALLGLVGQLRPASRALRSAGAWAASAGEHRLAIGNNGAAMVRFTVLLRWHNVTRAIPILPAMRSTEDLFSSSITVYIETVAPVIPTLADNLP